MLERFKIVSEEEFERLTGESEGESEGEADGGDDFGDDSDNGSATNEDPRWNKLKELK
jgi:hypothetical protein